ncbi:MAG: hypothetical protein BEN18_10285 [Epulopiscium sp. Nuni2H_MBin001]|nr:MAG: hypothetical protein BEN18_10285 [Epulopiscium sp. Nuni2H_MBin001]
MGLPNIFIEFKSKASTAIQRGDRGIVACVLVDDNPLITRLDTVLDIPDDLTVANKDFLKLAFLGGANAVNYVQLIVCESIADGLEMMQSCKFDYVAFDPAITAEDVALAATMIKTMRDNDNMKVKAVLPNCKADHEGIINFTTDNIVTTTKTYSTAEYCSRIASLLAGTPLQVSCTYYTVPEIIDVPRFKKSILDNMVNDGQFVIFNDGENCKVARAINSLTTIGEVKSEDLKSTKFVDIMDLIYHDIKNVCENQYVGKYANTYDNKINLVVAIQSYLEGLRNDTLLDSDIVTEIDIESQKAFLKTTGYDVDNMSEQEIKESNTKRSVFIKSSYKILDAIEDISVIFNI